MSSLSDGLGGEELQVSGLQAGGVSINPYFTGSITSASDVKAVNVYGTTSVSGATVKGTTISGVTFVDTNTGILTSSMVGASYGATVQAGSSTLSAGSNAWVVFGAAFASAPQSVVATDTKTAASLCVVLGSILAGSFYVEGQTAEDTFNWIAVGL